MAATVRVPTIFNDVGEATLRLVMKNQGTGGVGVTPSDLNAVTLKRYRIVYRRADGRNTPGVDVPFPVDGGVTRHDYGVISRRRVRNGASPGQARAAAEIARRLRRKALYLHDCGNYVLRHGPSRQ